MSEFLLLRAIQLTLKKKRSKTLHFILYLPTWKKELFIIFVICIWRFNGINSKYVKPRNSIHIFFFKKYNMKKNQDNQKNNNK